MKMPNVPSPGVPRLVGTRACLLCSELYDGLDVRVPACADEPLCSWSAPQLPALIPNSSWGVASAWLVSAETLPELLDRGIPERVASQTSQKRDAPACQPSNARSCSRRPGVKGLHGRRFIAGRPAAAWRPPPPAPVHR